jgi:excisionase family DNA binding protein
MTNGVVEESRLLSASELAARTGLHVATVRRAFRLGRIKGAVMTPGGHRRAPATAVVDLLRPLVTAVEPGQGAEGRA